MTSAALPASALPHRGVGVGVGAASTKKPQHNKNGHPRVRPVKRRCGGSDGGGAPSHDVPRGEATAPTPVRRRDFLVAATSLTAALTTRDPAAADTATATAPTPFMLLSVTGSASSTTDGTDGTPTETYATINAAVAAAAAANAANAAANDPVPITIRVSPGKYQERVVVPASLAGVLTVEAAPPSTPSTSTSSATSASEEDRQRQRERVVLVEHRTSAPYEATFEAAPGCTGLTLRNLTVRHSSPSVANNYAVFATAGSGVSLEGCDVSSETGSGVVGEGADIRVLRCKVGTAIRSPVHDCKTHGVAVYGDLYGEFGGGVVEGCEIVNNGQDGVLLRGGARGDVVSNVVAGNGRFGVELVNCGEGSTVVGNTITVAANGGGKKAGIGFGGLGTEDAVTLSGNTVSS